MVMEIIGYVILGVFICGFFYVTIYCGIVHYSGELSEPELFGRIYNDEKTEKADT